MEQQLFKKYFSSYDRADWNMKKYNLERLRDRLYNIRNMFLTDQKMQILRKHIKDIQQHKTTYPFPPGLFQRKKKQPMQQQQQQQKQQQQQTLSQKVHKQMQQNPIREKPYHPEKYWDVYLYIDNLINTIEETLKLVPKQRIHYDDLSMMPTQNKEIIELFSYDEKLLQKINDRCMPPKHHIRIVHAYFTQQKYVDASNLSDNDYFIILYKDRIPVSQIRYSFDKREQHEMTISSDTHLKYQNQKYNTLLRAVTVLLFPSLHYKKKPIHRIVSHAQNPLSVYSLLKLGFEVGNVYSYYYDEDNQQRVHEFSVDRPTTLQQEKHMKQYLIKIFDNNIDLQVNMVLRSSNSKQAIKLAIDAINRVCQDCLVQTKRKRSQSQQKP